MSNKLKFNPFERKTSSPNKDFYRKSLRVGEQNSLGYRCQEFTKGHAGKQHILFSGCSHTWPDGLEMNESWAWKLWQDHDNTSGFFNLAELGNSIPGIVFDIFKYCNEYGMPDRIFINLPDPERHIEQDDKLFKFWMPENHNDKFKSNALAFQYYYMLESFCKSNNIALTSISYSPITNSLFKEFETFHVIDEGKKDLYTYEFMESMTDKADALLARDNAHPGIAVQHAYYRLFREALTERLQIGIILE